MQWGSTTYYEFTENADSPREQNAVDGAQRTQIVDVVPGNVASRDQATLDFLGYANVQNVISRVDPTKRVNYIHRQTPLPYARRPLDVFQKLNRPAYCIGMPTGQGVGVGRKNPGYPVADYDHYRYALTFRPLPYPILDDSVVIASEATNPLRGWPDEGEALASGRPRYVQRIMDYGQRILSIMGSVLRYVDDVTLANRGSLRQAVPIQDNYLIIQYRWIAVPATAVPRLQIQSQLNTVNSIDFDGCPAGTLLFSGAKLVQREGPLGDDLYDVTYLFRFILHYSNRLAKALGWNGGWRNQPGLGLDVWPISSNGLSTGDPMFRSADPRLLFQPPQPT